MNVKQSEASVAPKAGGHTPGPSQDLLAWLAVVSLANARDVAEELGLQLGHQRIYESEGPRSAGMAAMCAERVAYLRTVRL